MKVARLTIPVVIALALVGGSALAARRAVVLPPQASPHGHTYAEWAAKWWQWALTQPVASNPVLDPNGADCAEGQSGHVWFLAGSFDSAPVTRTCTIPTGRALLVPVINYAYFAFLEDPPGQRTEDYVRSQVAVAKATALTASIDGVAVPDVASYYEQSTLFSVTLPADNLFGLPAGFVLEPSADAGYYLMVPPLPRGEHTISFSGTLAFPDREFSIDVTYHLTIV